MMTHWRNFGLCLILMDIAAASHVTERPNDQQDDVLVLLFNKIDDMQANIDRLEKAEDAMKQRIFELEKKLEKYETMHENEEKTGDEAVTDVPEEQRRSNHVISKINVQKRSQRGLSLRQNAAEQVAFTAYLDHVIRNLGKNQPVVYNMVLLNDGNGYSANTGIFHVPTTGVYLFSWAATARKLPNEHAYDVWVKLVVNGNHQLGTVAESRSDSDDNQGSNSAVLRCNQGDEVWTSHYSSYPDMFGDDNERTTSFMGVLLYMTE